MILTAIALTMSNEAAPALAASLVFVLLHTSKVSAIFF
jgi:hypothetical protein